MLAWAQTTLYQRVLFCGVAGGHHVPRAGGFLVVANHASHLDAGLVKTALGARGAQMRALAARDYFFAQAWSRWYFTHLTNVLPLDRQGGFRQALKRALAVIEAGQPLLIFPEGTRSLDGRMAPFRPAMASIALSARCDILPIHLVGTHDALPKGGGLKLRSRHVGALIGPPLRAEVLQRWCEGLTRHEAYRRVTLAVQLAVQALGQGVQLSEAALHARVRQASWPKDGSLPAPEMEPPRPQTANPPLRGIA